LVRHRIGVSIDQRTQRANSKEYLGKLATHNHFITPPSVAELIKHGDIGIDSAFDDYYRMSEQIYNSLLEAGISEDDARYHMPHNAETSMNFKVIYKALMHICSVRLCHMMQSEMVEIVRLMKQAVDEYDELLGSWLKPTCLISKICNRNENNPMEGYPLGKCDLTITQEISPREVDNTFSLTKFSKDATK
jgi:thymidylate synthase (FAD)